MTRKKRHAAHRREIRFFRAMFLISVLSQTEGGDSIHRIFKRLQTSDRKGKKERDLDILNAYMVGSNPIEAEQTEADRFVRIWKYG